MKGMPLPGLCSDGHVLVVTGFFPPQPGGSSVLMRNLLSCFDPSSYSVVTAGNGARVSIEGIRGVRVSQIVSSVRLSSRLDRWWRDCQLPWATARLVRLVQRVQPRVLVGVYPDLHFLSAAREAARATRVPWVAYLHDTLSESLSRSHLAERAARLQEQVFSEASRLLVMSRGMADLYQQKYHLACRPMEHTYLEPIPEQPSRDPACRQAFWGGAIYGINANAVTRVAEAMGRIDCSFLLATGTTLANLSRMGIRGSHLKQGFCSRRAEYLETLRQQGLLVLALDWPDESPIHHDELATIFPTKTPEYLASGRPILVHCPEHYFLARFFRANRCGLVVSERSVQALADAARFLLDSPDAARGLARSALSSTRLFSADRVARSFRDEIERAARLRWGEQTPEADRLGNDLSEAVPQHLPTASGVR